MGAHHTGLHRPLLVPQGTENRPPCPKKANVALAPSWEPKLQLQCHTSPSVCGFPCTYLSPFIRGSWRFMMCTPGTLRAKPSNTPLPFFLPTSGVQHLPSFSPCMCSAVWGSLCLLSQQDAQSSEWNFSGITCTLCHVACAAAGFKERALAH